MDGEISNEKLINNNQTNSLRTYFPDAYHILSQLASSVNHGLIIYDLDTRIILWNSFMENLSGKAACEVIGKLPAEIYPPLVEAGVVDAIKNVLSGSPPISLELNYVNPESEKSGWLTDSTSPLLNENQEIVGAIGVVKEITTRKKAEEEVIQSQHMLKSITDTIPDLIYIYDLVERKNIYSNDSALKYLGFTCEQMNETGSEIMTSIIHPDDLEKVNFHHSSFSSTSESEIRELVYRVKNKSGQWRWLKSREKSYLKNSAGETTKLIGIATDVTDILELISKLEESEKQLKEAQKLGRIGHWVWDTINQHLHWSDEIYSIFGRIPGECAPSVELFEASIHPEDFEMFVSQRQIMIAEKSDSVISHRIILPDGKIRHVEERSRVEIDERDNVIRIVGTVQDVTERKEAEEKALMIEKEFRVIFEQVAVGVAVVETQTGKFKKVNKKYSEITGYDMNEMIGKTIWDITHPDDFEAQNRIMIPMMSGITDEVNFQKRYVMKNGEIVWVNLRISPLWQEHETPGYHVAIVEDITKKRRADKILRSRITLNELASSLSIDDLMQKTLDEAEELTDSNIGFFHFIEEDQKTVFLEAWSTNTVNSMCKAEGKNTHYGVDKGGVWVDCVHERAPVIHNDYASLPHKKGLPEGHAPVIRELVIPIFREGKIAAILGVGNKHTDYNSRDVADLSLLSNLAFDIIRRKEAEDKNAEATLQWEQTFEAIGDMVALIDRDRNIIRYNDSMRKRFAHLGDLTGKKCYEVFHGQSNIRENCASCSAFETGVAANREIQEKHLGDCWLDVYAYPIIKKNGQIDQVVHVVRDITDRKQAEEETAKLHAQLYQSQKMEAVGQLAGGMAHDFNNMLGVIISAAELAKTEIEDGSPACDDLDTIKTAVVRARELTMKLLTFARRDKLSVTGVQVKRIIEDLVAVLKRTIPKKTIIKVDIKDDCVVPCDQNQIYQAMLNICNNAVDAMSGAGTLSITTEKILYKNEKCKICGKDMKGEHCVITVSDTGVGIPDEILSKITEPFFTTKGAGKGTGLGLSVTQGIIFSHDGHLHIDSIPGKGTNVRIFLPCDKSNEENNIKDDETAQLVGNETILVVDDEKTLLHLAGRILSKKGYRPLLAHGGKEALEIYEKHGDEISVVLLDIMMPGMDGAEASRKLQLLNPNVKIIFISGYSKDGLAEPLLNEKHRAFLQKPLDADALCAGIREMLDQR